ncbi:MAG: sulfotransferase [Vicingaceae bacterium]
MNWTRFNRRPIIVIGMHRSGTTMFTKALEQCGVFMGGDLSSNHESYSFTHFNEHLLEFSGGSWHNPVEINESSYKLDEKQFAQQFLHYKRKPLAAAAFVFGGKWGWKDPRNTFTLPYWIKYYFKEPLVIHVYRNGLDVAMSLQKRNVNLAGIERVDKLNELKTCFLLWESYLKQAFSLENKLGLKVISVSYENLLNAEENTVLNVEKGLQISGLEKVLKNLVVKRPAADGDKSLDSIRSIIEQSTWMRKLGYLD